jgi:CBS domain containing-hemolysin-like protein
METQHSLDLFGVAWRLGLTLFFVLLNGFFVAAEFALVRVRRSRIVTLADAGSRTAKVADHILKHMDRYLSACQLGITIASLVLGALGEPAVSVLLLAGAEGLGIHVAPDDPLLHGVALVLAFTVITILHMTVGEQAPKMWALSRSERMALNTAVPLRLFAAVFRPFIWVVNEISNWMLRVGGLQPGHGVESSHTAEEIRHILSRSAEAGHITERVWELSENVFQMIDLEVRHILVPRVDVVLLSLRDGRAENLERMRASGHSRLPLCEDGLDSVVGIVHVKDVFSSSEPEPDLRAVSHPPVFVPETEPISELILELQRRRSHVATVLDEHGTATGMVFLEDALEKIVGPIADEFDAPVRGAREVAPGTWEVNGDLPLPEADVVLGLELDHEAEDTLGGHVVAQLGRLPEKGDVVVVENFRLTVLEVAQRRIARLRVERLVPQAPPDDQEAESG